MAGKDSQGESVAKLRIHQYSLVKYAVCEHRRMSLYRCVLCDRLEMLDAVQISRLPLSLSRCSEGKRLSWLDTLCAHVVGFADCMVWPGT